MDCSYVALTKAHKPIGAENGAGVHIRAASVRLDADGHIQPDEHGRFMRELDEVRESLINCFSTMLVSMALLLTILVVLFLVKVHYGDEYGASGFAGNPSAWDVDAIAYFCANGGGDQMAVRRVLHGIESVLLSLCITGCLAGFFLAQCNLIIISALPGNMAMLEYLLRGGLRPIFTVYVCVDVPFILTPVAIPFIAARHSAIAFFGALVILVGCACIWGPFIIAPQEKQPLMLQNRTLQRRARAALARARTEAEGSAPPQESREIGGDGALGHGRRIV